MTRQTDRDEFMALMAIEGVPVDVARQLCRAAASLHRIAELQCSSEAADRDRVPCPGGANDCLCRDYGSYTYPASVSYAPDKMGHGTVPHINVQEAQIERRVRALCAEHGLVPIFHGDPRGAVLKLRVQSGRTNDWGQEGVCVP